MGGHLVQCTVNVTRNPLFVWFTEKKVEPSDDHRCNDTEMIRVFVRSFEPYVIDAFSADGDTNRTVTGIDIKIIDVLSRRLKMPYSILFDKAELNSTMMLGLEG